MAQVSRYPLSKVVYERIFEILFQSIADIKSRREVEEFFNEFLTPTERIVLAKRLAIAVLLAKDYDYDSIRKILRVSPPTIAEVNASLRYTGKAYKKVVNRILRAKKMEEFWEKIDDVLFGTIPPKGRNWKYWRKEREAKKRARRKPF